MDVMDHLDEPDCSVGLRSAKRHYSENQRNGYVSPISAQGELSGRSRRTLNKDFVFFISKANHACSYRVGDNLEPSGGCEL